EGPPTPHPPAGGRRGSDRGAGRRPREGSRMNLRRDIRAEIAEARANGTVHGSVAMRPESDRNEHAGDDPLYDPVAVREQLAAQAAVVAEPGEAAEPDRRPPTPAADPGLPQWPVMGKAAFHGPVGDMVWTIDPHTEADPVANLFQSLVAFGNVIGRAAY